MSAVGALRDLLKAWVQDQEPPSALPAGEEAEAVYHAAFHHQLAPWLAEQPVAETFPEALRKELRDDAEVHARLRLKQLPGWQRLQRDLPADEAPIVLKGWAVTTDLYPHLSQRTGWDIDLLLPEAAVETAHQALRAAGWIGDKPTPDNHHHLPPLHPPESTLHVELHRDLGAPPLPAELLDALIETAEPYALGTARWRRLNPAARIVHHLLHAGSDPVDGPVLRNLAEAAKLIHQADEATRQQAVTWAEAADAVGHPVRSLWALAAEWFEVDGPGSAADTLCSRYLRAAADRLPPHPTGWRARRELMRRRTEALQQGRRPSVTGAVAGLVHDFVEARRDWAKKELPQRPELAWQRIGDIVVVQGKEGRAHVLNPLASTLWEAVDGTKDWKTVCREIGVRNVEDLWKVVLTEVEDGAHSRPAEQ